MKSLALLFSLCCTAPTTLAAKGDPTIKEFFRVLLGFTGRKARPPQPLYVIGAGLPRTGTASFVVALEKLGLYTYHMKDGAVETPGHLDLWYGHYATKTVSIDQVLDDISAKGFNASSDSPACFTYLKQMERYPDAKVVMTVRGDGSGDAWAKSFEAAILQAMEILQEIPFRWIPMFQKIVGMSEAAFVFLGTDIDPSTRFPVKEQPPAAYDNWVEQVKASVPPNKLLIHAPKDGWAPLCGFLSPISDEVEAKCQRILELGEPYPHVNDKVKMRALFKFLRGITLLCKVSPLLLIVANTWRFLRPRTRSKGGKAE